MLVLTRRLDESIIIGGNIEVKVLRISGNQVHLGIKAPKEVALYRKEVFEKVVTENKRAIETASVTPEMLGELGRMLGKPTDGSKSEEGGKEETTKPAAPKPPAKDKPGQSHRKRRRR